MPNDRDTHFQGSAQQVAYKVLDLIPNSLHTYSRDDQKLVAQIIAQYAYDLMAHIIDHAPTSVSDADDWSIPDLTQWPD